MNHLQYFASSGGDGDLLSSLGIDWQLFVMQLIAFLVLLWVLKKWVYPPILAMLDKREATIKEGLIAAEEAKKAADETEVRTAAMLKNARRESQAIVASAKSEASGLVADAEQKAKNQADNILESARNEIAAEVAKAKKDLRAQMVDLVVDATQKVTLETVDAKKDVELIEKNLKEIE